MLKENHYKKINMCQLHNNVLRVFAMVAETVGSSEFRYTATRLRGVTIMKIRVLLHSNVKTPDPTEL